MPAEQISTELTTRDVLLQVDRRLTLIEDDLRTIDQRSNQLRQEMNAGFEGLRQEMNAGASAADQKIDDRTNQLRQEMNIRFKTLDQKIDDRTNQLRQEMNAGFAELRKEMNSKFHWTLGVVLASWISTIGTLLLK